MSLRRDDGVVVLNDGRRAQLWTGGAVDGPLVVVFHGCPATRHVAMTGHAAAEAIGVRLLCVNRPGYGTSTPHASSHDSVADDVVEVARRFGHERFAVLGMSVGGHFALTCAARYPDHVTALGLVATQVGQLEAGTVEERVERYRPGFAAYVDGLRPDDPDDEALAARHLAHLPAGDAEVLAGRGAVEVAASVREALAVPDGYLRDAALAFSAWEHQAARVRCRTRLWFGELDDRSTAAAAAPLVETLAEARVDPRVVVRTGTTHLATLLAHWPDVLDHLRD